MNIRPLTATEALDLAFHDLPENHSTREGDFNLTALFTTDRGPLTLRFKDSGFFEITTYLDEFLGSPDQCRRWLADEQYTLQKFVGYDEEKK